jgi:hypothetical protein
MPFPRKQRARAKFVEEATTIERLSFLEFRRQLEQRAQAAFAALKSADDDVVTTLFAETPAAAIVALREYDVQGLDQLGKAALATDAAVSLGSAEAVKGGLLMPALRPAECLLLLVAESERATAVFAEVGREPLRLGEWSAPTVRCEGLFVDALWSGLRRRPCPGCGAAVAALHRLGCDVEHCRACGGQRLFCDCDGSRDVWAGEWPGVFECHALGWYARRVDQGWASCDSNAPGARPDLNRLAFLHAEGYDGLYG